MTMKIIDRRVYDTRKAELVHDFWNNYGRGDFRFLAEDLYKTSKGNFFLLGSGGALTGYAVDAGGVTTGTDDNIIPLDKAEVVEWLENHRGSDKILELFPDECEEA